jgi:predicted butyrate kinase (DUF1464 family)
MPRVIGIDPGTVSIDVCGLEDGRLFLDRSIPTADALADPSVLIDLLEASQPLDLIAGPSGYGLPLTPARDLTEADIRLAYLIAEGDSGGIGGLRALMRAFARSSLPVVLTPGVIHLASVPAHRKVNRIDMGTADKVCAAVLAIYDQARRRRCDPGDVSFIMLELGGAFTAALAVDAGRIVDGVGGTSGPLGLRAAGALDGEVAYLAGTISKEFLFRGGVSTIVGAPDLDASREPATPEERLAWDAYVESAVKAATSLTASLAALPSPLQFGEAAGPKEIVLSGRLAHVARVRYELVRRLATVIDAEVHTLSGFADVAKQAAQGAALMADGLAGGASASLVDVVGIREARGTVLDHLRVISPAAARARLGIDS